MVKMVIFFHFVYFTTILKKARSCFNNSNYQVEMKERNPTIKKKSIKYLKIMQQERYIKKHYIKESIISGAHKSSSYI